VRTLEEALAPCAEARVVTEPYPPFRVTHVNRAWVALCGFTPDEVKGRTLAMIQGPDTDEASVARIVSDCVRGCGGSMEVTNYHKSGRPFRNRLEVIPLVNSGETAKDAGGAISHFLGILRPTPHTPHDHAQHG